MDNLELVNAPAGADLSPNSAYREHSSAWTRLEAWINRNAVWLALVILVPAVALRIYFALGCYLAPDEALRFLAARPATLHDAYKASRLLPQPPLYIFVLHWTMYLIGRSELALRLPSILAATGTLWLTFAWTRRLFGGAPALIGLLFLAVSQSAIVAGSEVRQFSLMLFFISAALYATERACSESSVRWAAVQGAFLALALLTDYSAAIPLSAIAVYVLILGFSRRLSREVTLAFGCVALVLAAEIAYLYFHLIRGSDAFSAANLSPLAPAFFNPPNDSILGYGWMSVFRTFVYMIGFGNNWSHQFALLVFLVFAAGLAAICAGRAKTAWPAAILISAPFVIGLLAAFAWLLPFGGTRHETYLLPFYAAGLSAGLLWVPRSKWAPVLLVATASACLWALANKAEDPGAGQPDLDPRYYSIDDMNAVLDTLHGRVPAGAPLFVDEATRLDLSYYLGRDDASLDALDRHMDNQQVLQGHPIITPAGFVWALPDADPLAVPCQTAQAAGVRPGNPIWIVKTEWPIRQLRNFAPGHALFTQAYAGINVDEVICP